MLADAFSALADACKAEVDDEAAPMDICEVHVDADACTASESWAVLSDAWKAVEAQSKSSSAAAGTNSTMLVAAAKVMAAWDARNASACGRASSASTVVARHSSAALYPYAQNSSTPL